MILEEIKNILEGMKTLQTGSGFWNPLIWIFVIIIVFLIVYIIRGFGEKSYKKGTEQVKSFISGNPEPSKKMHIRATNIYWGFMEGLKGYYDIAMKAHTGIINDYVLWFIGMMAILFVIIGVF